MAGPKQYAATGWYLEYRQGSSDKFYHVIITETGVCVIRWGRRGTAGQNSVTTYASFDEARDVGLRQVFAKKSKGYVQKYGDQTFMATTESIESAKRGSITALVTEWDYALRNGQFVGAKDAVLKHYDNFSESVKSLLERADTGDFDTTMDEFEQVEKVWNEINERHAEVSAALSLAKATLMQKLLTGAL